MGSRGAALRCLVAAVLAGLLLLGAAAVGWASAEGEEAGTALTIDPPTRSIGVGETVTTAVRVEDVEALYTFSFDLSFDPEVVEGIQVVDGGFLSPDWRLENTVDNEEGRISYALSQLNPADPVSGTGQLAVVTWRGAAEGSTSISITQASLYARGSVALPARRGGGHIAVGDGVEPPTVAALSPPTIAVRSPAFSLTVEGTSFVTESVVQWHGSPRPTTFVSATRLTAAVGSQDVAAAGTTDVRVVNPIDLGGTSEQIAFTVTNPLPTVMGMSPVAAVAGGPAFTLTLRGAGFVVSSTVRWNGSPRPTTWISPTRLTADIDGPDITAAGTVTVSVTNPAPGGGTSDGHSLEISAPGPGSEVIYLPFATRAGS